MSADDSTAFVYKNELCCLTLNLKDSKCLYEINQHISSFSLEGTFKIKSGNFHIRWERSSHRHGRGPPNSRDVNETLVLPITQEVSVSIPSSGYVVDPIMHATIFPALPPEEPPKQPTNPITTPPAIPEFDTHHLPSGQYVEYESEDANLMLTLNLTEGTCQLLYRHTHSVIGVFVVENKKFHITWKYFKYPAGERHTNDKVVLPISRQVKITAVQCIVFSGTLKAVTFPNVLKPQEDIPEKKFVVYDGYQLTLTFELSSGTCELFHAAGTGAIGTFDITDENFKISWRTLVEDDGEKPILPVEKTVVLISREITLTLDVSKKLSGTLKVVKFPPELTSLKPPPEPEIPPPPKPVDPTKIIYESSEFQFALDLADSTCIFEIRHEYYNAVKGKFEINVAEGCYHVTWDTYSWLRYPHSGGDRPINVAVVIPIRREVTLSHTDLYQYLKATMQATNYPPEIEAIQKPPA